MPVQNLVGSVSLAETYSQCTNSQVLLTANASTQLLAVNANRAYAVVVNNSDIPITLAFFKDTTGTAVLNQGIVLGVRGSSYEIGMGNLFVGRLAAIAPTPAAVGIVECVFS